MMTGIERLACLWTLLMTQVELVCSDVQFFEVQEGESVMLPCVIEPRHPPPVGVYLRRTWLYPSELLFMYTKHKFILGNDHDTHRTNVSGDPSSHSLNVTISELRVNDTDRYNCEFMVETPSSEDERVPGKKEFFLLVTAGDDAPGSLDVGWVDVCTGGSAVIPCGPSQQRGLAVEGVNLKRQRGQAPVELLYHSKHHHSNKPPSSLLSLFHAERVQLSSAPSPSGISYKLTLWQLRPEDSGLYSCQLLLHSKPESSTRLGRPVVFLSVQGSQCSCSIHSPLVYTLSAALVAVLLLLGCAIYHSCQSKARCKVKSHHQGPIYEEMAGVQPLSRKLAPRHLEETEYSQYRNCLVRNPCPENHYERPSENLKPKDESHK